MSKLVFDFSGWATKANLKCMDGRVIKPNAFKQDNGLTVPLVWNHQHSAVDNILGHALLENRSDGVYAYCTFNSTVAGQNAKELVKHGDVSALSIYANRLKQVGQDVIHGAIREVSLVLAGANPGAYIDTILAHSDSGEEEAIISFDIGDTIEQEVHRKDDSEVIAHGEEEPKDDETMKDVFDSMTEKQQNVVYALIAEAMENEEPGNDEDKEEDETVKHNVFDLTDRTDPNTLAHSELMAKMPMIFTDAKKHGSLRESTLAHGIENIEYLFPEAQSLDTPPSWISREMGWVQKVMKGVRHTPFSRIKSMHADIREDEARAKGYIKGAKKTEEVFSLLKRTTTPQTVYKKQKLDRDDVIDIVDFDVVAWVKSDMRLMLDEEIARAILVSDGRLASDDDKIQEQHIRPIWTDDDLYVIKTLVQQESDTPNTIFTSDKAAKAFIRSAIRSRKQYKGSGSPTLFTTEDVLTDCLLLEDHNGRVIYESPEKLATALRVKEIITVPVMENQRRVRADSAEVELMGIIVNLSDYNVGADKGGAIAMFDDFDIDYNQQKYLIETRCSGAMIRPFGAIVLERLVSGTPSATE